MKRKRSPDDLVDVADSHNVMPGQVRGSVLQAGAVQGDVHIHSAAYSDFRVVPHQLLHAPAFLTNRDRELAQLGRVVRPSGQGSLALVVLTGPGGVGKTALALFWLAGLADHYPDGQLYAECQVPGTTDPVLIEDVLGQFLRGLGVSPKAVPPHLAERAALFRSVTADRTLAIMLDNVVAAAQVRTLLPSSPTSLMVVTSRHPLSSLQVNGAHVVRVDPLDERSALELVAHQVGAERVAAEREEAARLTRLCGGLPIALCVAGARIASRPRRPLARTVAELADERRRLGVLSMDDLSVSATFDVSYSGLPNSTKQVYRLLGLHPGNSVCAELVAAAAGVDATCAQDDLETLVDSSLLQDYGQDSYTLHDLVRLHARDRAEREDAAAERDSALRRMLDWYVLAASSAARTVMPARPRWDYQDALSADFVAPQGMNDYRRALDWLEGNRHNMVAGMRSAAEREWDSVTCHLAHELQPLFILHKHDHQAVACFELALPAAQRAGEWLFENDLRKRLARTYIALGWLEQATVLTDETVHACEEIQDRDGLASAMKTRGLLAVRTGRLEDAAEDFTRTLDLLSSLNRHRSRGLCLIDLGTTLTRLGRHAQAAAALEEAGSLLSTLEPADPYNAARAWTALGRARAQTGDFDAADELLSRAVIAFGRLGSDYESALAHSALADLAELADKPDTAARHRTEAETLLGGLDLQRTYPVPRGEQP